MKTLSLADAARDLGALIEELERTQEEVVLVRGNEAVARLVPESDASLVELEGTLDDATAEALLEAIAAARRPCGILGGSIQELRNPWDS